MPVIDERAEVAIESILLATDFSSSSEKAAAYAKALAHRFGSTVELTHIVDLSAAMNPGSAHAGLTIGEMRRTGSKHLEQLFHDFSGIRAKINMLESFSLPDAILSSARESIASLIVMGTVSKHVLERLILGSTAETVIRKSTCPVLTIGPYVGAPSQDPLAFRAIVYATDFSEQAAKAAIYALSFAQDSGAHLYLCHVLGSNDFKGTEKPALQTSFTSSLKRLIPQSAYDWCNPECIIEHGETASAILSLADRVHADLIVLGARKSSFWLDYIETGVTPAILAGAKCPVLTVC